MDDGSGQVVANGAGATYAPLWIFQAMATTTLILRIISRSFLTRDIGWEDVIMAFGWAVNLASTIIITISSNTMIHAIKPTTTPSDLENTTVYALKLSLISGAINPNTIWLPKISVALLLSRLLQPKPWTKLMLIVPSVVGFVGGGIGSALITFLQCNPIAGQWDPERYHPTCWDPSVMVDYNIPWAVLSSALDIIYAIYPATMFWKMRQLPVSRKLAISILMGLGLISGGVGIYKTTLTHLLGRRDQGSDVALTVSHILNVWTTVEADFIISAACIPLSRPVWRLAIVFVGDVWGKVRKRVGLGPAVEDSAVVERSGERRVNMGYIELPERTWDVDRIAMEGRERHTVRDDIEMRYSSGGGWR
ncbi:hypothetical protein DPV78_006275 [Talaromyces pinophilus]|nr:hypothetical protein DPV78_006275 [Talaromyces pinophilus]PCG96557.1 Hypothetical protein PENO1_067730 [Penicillium occitanis (nom. inval.)]PCH04161.1 hypothetical protein PENOC_034760 [Penicillium occitanis (nom. inval.)]